MRLVCKQVVAAMLSMHGGSNGSNRSAQHRPNPTANSR
jgi:hypothetical protein